MNPIKNLPYFLVLVVTVLTSLNNKSLKEIGHTKNVKQLVLKQAALIKKSGCDGIVCSAQEAMMVRKKYKNLLIITPGIRLPGDSSNDQMRIMTPKQAFKNKVSGIVIGRSLTKGNIKNNLQSLINHLKYPPTGERSYGVNRAQGYGFDFEEGLEMQKQVAKLQAMIEELSRSAIFSID